MTLAESPAEQASSPQPDLSALSARRIAELIGDRSISSAEVVEHFIAKLHAANPVLNAITVDLSDSARTSAAAVDRALARGQALPPLAGLPVTIKECFDLAGTASTFGLRSRRDGREAKDDPYVAALRAAGAIPIAKTNLSQLMIFMESDNPLYGRTNNPWDLGRSCGGSSGGEAAAIAAGLSPLGLGNDLGGSVRIPAAFCGITAIRPTEGRTPDHCTHGLPVGQRSIVSQVGPIARRVEDLVLALRVLDRTRDPYFEPGPVLGDPSGVQLTQLRFATFTGDGEFPVAPAVRRAVGEAAQILAATGATAIEWRPPDLSRAVDLLFACLSADRGQALRRLLRGNHVDRRIRSLLMIAAMPSWLRAMAGAALRASGQRRLAANIGRFASGTADEYWKTTEAIATFRRDLLQSFLEAEGGSIDVLLGPIYPTPAIRHGATELMPMAGSYAALANVSGFPAGVVPITRVRVGEESDRPATSDLVDQVARETERGSAGLPIAVQVIGRPWQDHVVLAVMAAIEAEALKRPDYPSRPLL